MEFTIAQRHLTDATGKPIADQPMAVSFHVCEADSVDEAVSRFTQQSDAEVIGNVLKFPGFHAVATVRTSGGVFTLQVSPSSQSFAPAP